MSVKVGQVEHSGIKGKWGVREQEGLKCVRGWENMEKEGLQGVTTTTTGLWQSHLQA